MYKKPEAPRSGAASRCVQEAYNASIICVWLFAVLVRHLVSLHPHSGMATPPMYGDYEAQRHWMEIATTVHIRDWYRATPENDLQYWGLDYPPLTAYVSWLCGVVSRAFDPASMELFKSRGYETPKHKVAACQGRKLEPPAPHLYCYTIVLLLQSFMRLTVLVTDVIIYFPAVWAMAHELTARTLRNKKLSRELSAFPPRWAALLVTASVLLQPALVLIDYGHFQYNSTALGLALMGVVQILRGREVLGSVLFSMSLAFKHIALYYATAFFFFLLRRSYLRRPFPAAPILNVAKLGVTVISTLAVMFAPFCLVPSSDGEGCLQGLGHVIHRLFPLQRGLFEDKVANAWYTLSVLLDLRAILPVDKLAAISLATTVLFLVPSSIDLLREPPTPRRFILALLNSSLAFFLFSFQVHEKSLLFALLPLSLLVTEEPIVAWWGAGMLGPFSMFPLLRRDKLALAYVATIGLHVIVTAAVTEVLATDESSTQPTTGEEPQGNSLRATADRLLFAPYGSIKRWWALASIAVMLVLHLLEVTVSPPARYPHIYSLLFSVSSAVNLGLLLLYTNAKQILTARGDDERYTVL